MTLTKEEKQEIIKEHGRAETDTGSPEVQIAMLTRRINQLTEHLRTHKHDHSLAARPAEAGRTAPPLPELSPDARISRAIAPSSRSWGCGASSRHRGWKFERALTRALTQTSTFLERKWRNYDEYCH